MLKLAYRELSKILFFQKYLNNVINYMFSRLSAEQLMRVNSFTAEKQKYYSDKNIQPLKKTKLCEFLHVQFNLNELKEEYANTCARFKFFSLLYTFILKEFSYNFIHFYKIKKKNYLNLKNFSLKITGFPFLFYDTLKCSYSIKILMFSLKI